MAMKIRSAKALIGWILLCELAGALGSVFTISAIPSWYASLSKPWFTPPNWLFGPVWLTLYLLMGIAAYWAHGRSKRYSARPMIAFYAQLAINALWSALFFGLRSPVLGLVAIVALWIAIAVTIYEFSKVRKEAAWVLLPYIAWVSIALLLNYYVVLLNP